MAVTVYNAPDLSTKVQSEDTPPYTAVPKPDAPSVATLLHNLAALALQAEAAARARQAAPTPAARQAADTFYWRVSMAVTRAEHWLKAEQDEAATTLAKDTRRGSFLEGLRWVGEAVRAWADVETDGLTCMYINGYRSHLADLERQLRALKHHQDGDE